MKYLQRNQLRKAMQAFRKTVEYEPANPANYCNLAGVLSELGDFEASNELLLHVLSEVDPDMAECRFYLANNYANMGDFETAEKFVLEYLDADPDGEYVGDAEEMLTVLIDEFGGGDAYDRWEEERRRQEVEESTKNGRKMLEDGQFEAAVESLEKILQEQPDNIPAWNNLSLAYYYTGRHEEALKLAHQVLQEHPDNLHALCNLAVYKYQLGPREEFEIYAAKLQKVFPMNYDHAMKVGTTLGLVGQHKGALEVFQSLIRLVTPPEPVLIHSLAAAAANCGMYAVAKRWWKVLSQGDECVEVGQYYLQALQKAEQLKYRRLPTSYQCELPLQIRFDHMRRRMRQNDPSAWRSDPLLRAAMYWGLRNGSEETQRAVVRILSLIADGDAEKTLRAFLRRADVSQPLQAATLYALQRMGARGSVDLFKDGSVVTLSMSDVPQDIILDVDSSWRWVFDEVENWLRQHQKDNYISGARRAWTSFLKHTFQKSERGIGKPEIWAAALLYAVMKQHNDLIRQKDAAEWFNVSSSSVSKAASRLNGFFVRMP
jgi:tetratricopeptide (TPR) repeat protein